MRRLAPGFSSGLIANLKWVWHLLTTKEQGDPRFRSKANLLLLGIVGLVVSAILWAANAEVNAVTRASGKVVPSRQVQVIQSFESGIIKVINAKEGRVVEEGQTLIELDQTASMAEYNQLVKQISSLKARVVRLTTEVNGTQLLFPPEVIAQVPDVVASETQLFLGKQAELASDVRVLESQTVQKRQELAEAKANLPIAERGLQLAQDEIRMVQPVVERGYEPEITLLQLRRAENEFAGKKVASMLAIERLSTSLQEMEQRRRALIDKAKSSAYSELSSATIDLSKAEQQLPAIGARVGRTEIKSPVRGYVNRILVNTVGGVAQSGMPLIEVIPLDDTLQIEAWVRPADIAFMKRGQKVKVKLTAYDYARYGTLDGIVETIGGDAVKSPIPVANQKTEGDLAYPIQVRTASDRLSKAGEKLEIIPGMIAEVDILGEKRTVLQYILRPMVKIRDHAFREGQH